MAVAVVMEFEDASLDQYDQVIEKMGLDPRGNAPSGGLFHWVAQTDSGIIVTDVWEDAEQFEKFSQEQIGPYTREVGITTAPKVTFYEVHNYMKEG
jgi:hypothetical protein